MSETMGYSGLFVLYSYFGVSGALVRFLSPPFGEYIAQTQKREGTFRRAHSRLIQHAEEVAFLDGSAREKQILNKSLREVTTWSHFYFYSQFKQGIVDQYALKYFASMIGYPVLAFPFMYSRLSPAQIAARYKENNTLIQSSCESVGDLLMVYKKLQRLAGFTARVTELIEVVDVVASQPSNVQITGEDDGIHFDNITVHSPDGRLLVKDLSLSVKPGESVFITGANGAGKTSIFRVLAGLWRATSGTVVRPAEGLETTADGEAAIFYVPQRPYLVSGTLRDQVMYPLPGDPARDDEVMECLQLANLTKVVDSSADGLGRSEHDWTDVLSGGEKQRVGLARLYFHRPTFAILDEATSAINPDEEGLLYAHIETLGITAFSIAHRMEAQAVPRPPLALTSRRHGSVLGDESPPRELEHPIPPRREFASSIVRQDDDDGAMTNDALYSTTHDSPLAMIQSLNQSLNPLFGRYYTNNLRNETTTASHPHPPHPAPPPTRTPRARARARPLSSFSPPFSPSLSSRAPILPSPISRDTSRTRRTRRPPPNTSRTPTARVPVRCNFRTNHTCEVIPTRRRDRRRRRRRPRSARGRPRARTRPFAFSNP